MQNRAKCKLCESIIESFHRHDYVSCKCGEIAIDGGLDYFRCAAKNWENFLRINDEGNEIVVQVKEQVKEEEKTDNDEVKPLKKKDMINILDDMIKNIENLPPEAMVTSVNQYDLMSLMMVISSIFKAKK